MLYWRSGGRPRGRGNRRVEPPGAAHKGTGLRRSTPTILLQAQRQVRSAGGAASTTTVGKSPPLRRFSDLACNPSHPNRTSWGYEANRSCIPFCVFCGCYRLPSVCLVLK